jgi:hypothetical protein
VYGAAMSVESTLAKTMSDVPKAVAAGIVDMGSGMLMGVKTVDEHPPEVLDLVSAATKDLFEGDNVTAIEDTFKRIRGVQTSQRYFQEIVVVSTNLVHVFARLKSNQAMVLVVVCRADTNLGLALMKMRGIASSESI